MKDPAPRSAGSSRSTSRTLHNAVRPGNDRPPWRAPGSSLEPVSDGQLQSRPGRPHVCRQSERSGRRRRAFLYIPAIDPQSDRPAFRLPGARHFYDQLRPRKPADSLETRAPSPGCECRRRAIGRVLLSRRHLQVDRPMGLGEHSSHQRSQKQGKEQKRRKHLDEKEPTLASQRSSPETQHHSPADTEMLLTLSPLSGRTTRW